METNTAHISKVLLLGGTAEAASLAERLAACPNLHVISSQAGRVVAPRRPAGEVRFGGFGGVTGLKAYLQVESIDLVVDATHPFAAQISRHAEIACQILKLPLLAYARPPWTRVEGDRWDEVSDCAGAADLVQRRKGRVFLAIGRQELYAFRECSDADFVIRSIDMPPSLPPKAKVLLARGPFQLEAELALLRTHAIDYIVSKNSGGPATYSKIEAARMLGLRVIMIQRPGKHTVPTDANMDLLFHRIIRLQQEIEGCLK